MSEKTRIKRSEWHAQPQPARGCRGLHGSATRPKESSTSLLADLLLSWRLGTVAQQPTSMVPFRPFMPSPSENFYSPSLPLACLASLYGVSFKQFMIRKGKGALLKA